MQMRQVNRFLKSGTSAGFATVAAIAAVAGGGAGCSSPTATERPINVIAIDRSGSTEAIRPAQLRTLTAAFARAAKRREELTVYAVDRQSLCVYSPRQLKAADRVPDEVERQFAAGGNAATRTRTRPAAFWEQMAQTYATETRPVRILYLTDGGNDWAAEARKLEGAVTKLAANPRVKVGVVGVNADQYRTLQAQFAAFGAERSVIRTGHDTPQMIAALDEWRKKEGAQ